MCHEVWFSRLEGKHCRGFGGKDHSAPVCFWIPVFHVLNSVFFRKEMLLQTVAETKPWHNQQVLGVFFCQQRRSLPSCGFVQPVQLG